MKAGVMDFYLPENLNANLPPEKRGLKRDQVRLMTLSRKTGEIQHDRFDHLPYFLQPGDLIILNNSRTIPASLQGDCIREGVQILPRVEIRLARRIFDDTWDALIIANSVRMGDVLHFSEKLTATVIAEIDTSPLKTIKFNKGGSELLNLIYILGAPIRYEYIEQPWDLNYYQNVFATHPGSVEMPSAGRAFSWELLFDLKKKGIQVDFIQLHTGLSYLLEDHVDPKENPEEYHIRQHTMEQILKAHSSGKKVIAVGTTVVRALESAARNEELSGATNLYIDQDSSLKIVDGIITGFHEPRASHLDMLTAFLPKHHLFHAYQQAIHEGYLWHEFGDMNLII
ncbi:S-adenosylmethionine:tRNA ribosyltransferase-isomerase [Mesobacillus stamsii]|uniref:S-adenosylmethionine:tRNA ribosyltransferase-isomerase n=1 Tax=Mesobacillus stamsii TaxID=225347 RepID=A0ABU0G019_9BACI|nr:S-adenosylmethionine:tRNA ribosyltransferase-isomerase [Mesobacillus stamsii]MDQ0415537.1 S-adenosylmethionine:tRNA ribosyltransferase-isomerase [Mesobacillus stamsii]